MRTLIILLGVLFSACVNDNVKPDIDWQAFKEGVIQINHPAVETQISKLLVNTFAAPTSDDQIGQQRNFINLIKILNDSQVIRVQKFCYACIKTYPGQTEITITTDSMGVNIRRIIDIYTPEDNFLSFAGIHNTSY